MEAEQQKLHDSGNELTDTTTTIVAKARSGGDEEVIGLGDKLYAQLLAVRVANWRTQATLDPKGLAILASEVGKAAEIIAALEAAGGAQSLRARVGQLKVLLNEYASTAEVLHQAPAASTRAVRQQDRAADQRDADRHREGARAVAGVFRGSPYVDRALDREHSYNPRDHRRAGPADWWLDRLLPGTRGLQPDHGADPKHARAGGRQLRRRASRPRPQGRSRQHRKSRRRVQSAGGREGAARSRREGGAGSARRSRAPGGVDENGRRIPDGGRRHRPGCGSRRFLAAGRAGRQDRTGAQCRHPDQRLVRQCRAGAARSRSDAGGSGRGRSVRAHRFGISRRFRHA